MVFAKKEKIKEEKKGKCYRSASHMMFSSGIFGFQKKHHETGSEVRKVGNARLVRFFGKVAMAGENETLCKIWERCMNLHQ